MQKYRNLIPCVVGAWTGWHYRDVLLDTPYFFHNASRAKNLLIESGLTLLKAIAQIVEFCLDALAVILEEIISLGDDFAFFVATDES
jgi:hypothetical protein